MSAKLVITNRQRRVHLDLSDLRALYEDLRVAVLDNLSVNPPEHLVDDDIAAIAERGQFSVAFVSNKKIQELNIQWMGKDKPTDVLSFPLELEPPTVPTLPWEVGEIIISAERAQEQAAELGHSFRREMGFLFAHGMLHILGFDHMEPDEEKEMFGRQREILNKVGLKR